MANFNEKFYGEIRRSDNLEQDTQTLAQKSDLISSLIEFREKLTGSKYGLDELRRIYVKTAVSQYITSDNRSKCDNGSVKKLRKVNDHKFH